MTAINFETKNGVYKIEKIKQNLKPTLIPGKKIYYSDRYIYLDKSEFGIVWHNVGLFIFLHALWFKGLYGILTLDPEFAKCAPITFLYALLMGFGVTCGAHRLWAHKSYKARLPLRIFLMFGHIVAGQNNLIVWCRDHRVHHKYSDTDADPHNTNRGFFFTHMGWLMYKKHPDVLVKGRKIDVSDLYDDPLVRFQAKYYYLLYFLANIVLPMFVSMHFFGASFYSSFLYSFMVRYASALHATWFVNSAAHMFGEKPYNDKIRPVENVYVSFFSVGEGFHNYHHTFPYDYATSEFSKFNLAKRFIEFMAKIGLAYDLKRASSTIVNNSKLKVQRSLYKVNREDDNNNYTIEYECNETKSNDHLNSQYNNDILLEDEKLKNKLEKIENDKDNDQMNKNKKDLNNNILTNLSNESNEIKSR